MNRTLLALGLALATSTAFAADPGPADVEESGCPKVEQAKEKAAGSEPSPAAARPGAPAPVRPRSDTGSRTPRWHSLLPGMIR